MDYTTLSKKDLFGFIPAPIDSSPEKYLARVEATQNAFQEKNPDPAVLDPYIARVESTLQTSCNAILAQITKQGLLFWEAGASWIEEHESQGLRIYRASIQFHPSLFSPSRTSWAMDPFIVVLHEYIHSLRAPLESAKYEEYITYTISKMASKTKCDTLRCLFGPLFESQKEVWIFFILSYVGSFLLLYFLDIDTLVSFILFQCIYSVTISLPFLIRLGIKWYRILYVFRYIQERVPDPNKHIPLFIRLSDIDVESIYTTGKAGQDWRWDYYCHQYEFQE